jgi:hypothetical protein
LAQEKTTQSHDKAFMHASKAFGDTSRSLQELRTELEMTKRRQIGRWSAFVGAAKVESANAAANAASSAAATSAAVAKAAREEESGGRWLRSSTHAKCGGNSECNLSNDDGAATRVPSARSRFGSRCYSKTSGTKSNGAAATAIPKPIEHAATSN